MSSLYNGWASRLVPVCEVTERLLRDEEMRRAGLTGLSGSPLAHCHHTEERYTDDGPQMVTQIQQWAQPES